MVLACLVSLAEGFNIFRFKTPDTIHQIISVLKWEIFKTCSKERLRDRIRKKCFFYVNVLFLCIFSTQFSFDLKYNNYIIIYDKKETLQRLFICYFKQ